MSDGVISMLDCDNEGESLVELIESGRKILREAGHKNPVLVLEANTAIAYEERVGKLITENKKLREALEHIKTHQMISAGDMAPMSAIYQMATKALEATK